ncbi:hypothetical protein ABT381_29725 [Streptomyces sp. NPDC000151]|uniref:hypothetical protein n=1 Tax=Streptomyces sp. NPDC000151 TaxID=3154244 RepID=UPI0033167088
MNRIKKIKRQLYGRAGFELLRKVILLQWPIVTAPRDMPGTGVFQAVATARYECVNGACGSCERSRAVLLSPLMKAFTRAAVRMMG